MKDQELSPSRSQPSVSPNGHPDDGGSGALKPSKGERQWRSLSSGEMNAVKMAQLGGYRAATLWNDAVNALHAYAQASDCPPGHDVVLWFDQRSEAYRTSLTAAHYSLPSQPPDEPTAGHRSRDPIINTEEA